MRRIQIVGFRCVEKRHIRNDYQLSGMVAGADYDIMALLLFVWPGTVQELYEFADGTCEQVLEPNVLHH